MSSKLEHLTLPELAIKLPLRHRPVFPFTWQTGSLCTIPLSAHTAAREEGAELGSACLGFREAASAAPLPFRPPISSSQNATS